MKKLMTLTLSLSAVIGLSVASASYASARWFADITLLDAPAHICDLNTLRLGNIGKGIDAYERERKDLLKHSAVKIISSGQFFTDQKIKLQNSKPLVYRQSVQVHKGQAPKVKKGTINLGFKLELIIKALHQNKISIKADYESNTLVSIDTQKISNIPDDLSIELPKIKSQSLSQLLYAAPDEVSAITLSDNDKQGCEILLMHIDKARS